LPLLEYARTKAKPAPRTIRKKPAPQSGADAFNPRQRIFTDPARPTHPRQTLINPQAPPEAPKASAGVAEHCRNCAKRNARAAENRN